MVNFTIQNVLIAASDDYATVDVHIVDGAVAAIAPNLPVIGTVIDGKNKLLLPGFSTPTPTHQRCGNGESCQFFL